MKCRSAARRPIPIRTIAGDCLVRSEGLRDRTVRGTILTVVKPDNTVLVHDTRGYQPAAWLTRPSELSLTRDPLWLVAVDGDETLRIEAVGDVAVTEHEATVAGTPVGTCRCGDDLVRSGGEVVCLGCGERFGLPSGATTTGEECSCGLPTVRVDRGQPFELCLDRECGSLLDAVRAAFEGEWDCPECGSDLEILRRGGLLAGCEAYPSCETAFSIPDGVVDGRCGCGLPVFETASGRRCLGTDCQSWSDR